MAADLAIDDAKRFLYLHPLSTTAEDNPVLLLQELVKCFDDNLAEKIEEDQSGEEADVEERAEDLALARVTNLMTFIKGLRDDLKISEAEYQVALGLSK